MPAQVHAVKSDKFHSESLGRTSPGRSELNHSRIITRREFAPFWFFKNLAKIELRPGRKIYKNQAEGVHVIRSQKMLSPA
jgi:hypothetical protein